MSRFRSVLFLLLSAIATTTLSLIPAHAIAADRSSSAPAGSLTADEPTEVIADGIEQDGFYLHPTAVNGDLPLWSDRIRRALTRVEFAEPISVAVLPDNVGVDELDSGPFADLPALFGISDGLLVVGSSFGSPQTLEAGDLSRVAVQDWRRIERRARAVDEELQRSWTAKDGSAGTIAVAEVWIRLRLAASDPPSPRELTQELAGDASLFEKRAPYRESSQGSGEMGGPWVWPVMLVMLAIGVGIIGWTSVRAVRAGGGPGRGVPVDTWASGLTAQQVEEEVTGLAERFAASEASPGQHAYERALASLEAAKRYVDSELLRDRVGVHLLVQDGHRALSGESSLDRCFIHPRHLATTSVTRKGRRSGTVDVPVCAECAGRLAAGQPPRALVVPDESGKPAAYYATDDVWSQTGYGSLDDNWATVVLIDSLDSVWAQRRDR